MHHLPLALCLSLSVFTQLSSAYTWPSPQYDALEGLLYEGRKSDGSSLSSIVHPCRKRTGTLASIAAEWLRFAFHDMATHNVNDGTGGLDGSLVYELDRPENFGQGFNQTMTDFENYPNKLVSRADIISIGAIFAVSTCGGPIIPFRGGRIDAYSAGNFGTPQPQDDLGSLTTSFQNQGFNAAEMIKLVACGHTMGGVRSSDFPELVPAGPNPNVPNIENFDTSTQFDNAVVTEYLSGSTKNVLVVTSNATMASDLRVFQSDGNSTMRSLASASTFTSECQSILGRMLDTVPAGVTLTDEITLLPAKVNGVQLSIEKQKLVFKASLRLIQPINATANANRTVTMLWCDKYGSAKACKGATRSSLPVNTVSDNPNISPVTMNLGYYFINYNFVVPIDSAASISNFWFQVDEHNGTAATTYNNGGSSYVLPQDQIFFVPMLSHVDNVPNATNTQAYTRIYNIVAAVRNDTTPSRVYVDGFDSSVHGFPYSVNVTVDLALNSSLSSGVPEYSLYSGIVNDSGYQLTLDLHATSGGVTYTQDFMATTYLDNTPYVPPSTPSNAAVKSSGSRSSFAHVFGWTPVACSLSLTVALTLWIL
ncbi:hypothetical protein K443DRAFT_672308 [Laccaria amethystina LaAM-08-1]|uniref:Peroxidase n=1 Tax=Laccaria amethystina LaAM-08-1 TaxID=1095629 RepID=A0A0C9X971_9AGAR|nr:hypothetical protein K443DRAFT_672308 [Laccaria amethystina LaAM-08-1]